MSISYLGDLKLSWFTKNSGESDGPDKLKLNNEQTEGIIKRTITGIGTHLKSRIN